MCPQNVAISFSLIQQYCELRQALVYCVDDKDFC